ncbi:DUF6502 family protein [Parvibaculaceae bacterium PLY_AMNH_Bact1]|nr:DUF6502 family protein [Parvibaculaceae bacterium PLY_AMNH_Bact1]
MGKILEKDGPTGPLVGAVRTILRPLVRGLVRRGVQLPQIVEELKALYVEAARQEAAKTGRVTQSAISVMSGVHRKDVKRLMETTEDAPRPPSAASMGSKLIGIWMGRTPFAQTDGSPQALFEKRSDGSPSFEELVGEVSQDVRSRAVLDDWLRLNVVLRRDDGLVELNTEAFATPEAEVEALHFFGRNLRDHVSAGLHNLEGQDPRFIDRATFYWGLTDASIEKLRLLAQELGAEAVREANKQALEFATEDRERGDGSNRMTFGVYFYAEQDGPESSKGEDAK